MSDGSGHAIMFQNAVLLEKTQRRVLMKGHNKGTFNDTFISAFMPVTEGLNSSLQTLSREPPEHVTTCCPRIDSAGIEK